MGAGESGESNVQSLARVSIDDPRWLAFLESQRSATAFHHPAWGRLVERCYGFRPFVLAATDGGGTIEAGLPLAEVSTRLQGRRWVSMPFVDYCPPLVPASAAPGLSRGLDAARLDAGISSVDVRAPLEGPALQGGAQWVRHVLELGDDPAAQFDGFHRMTRRNVRHAERSGLTIRQGDGESALTEDFYRLHVETRRRLGVPVQPRRFFRLLWEELIAKGLGFVSFAYSGSKPVAGAVFLTWNGNMIYKFGASDADAWHARPNNLIFWHAIQKGIETHATSLDFGRSEVDQEGLRSFKAGWGAREEELVYAHLPERGAHRTIGHASSALAPAIRRSPAWFARLVGELFYRYAA